MPELIIIFGIVMVVFGAGRLPEIGSALGKSITNFRKASEEAKNIGVTHRNET